MKEIIYVLNASSRVDTGITAELGRSLQWCAGPDLPRIECVTLADGPNGIVTERDSDDAAPAVHRFVERHATDSAVAAFVVACFSDPGVSAARDLTHKPVIGIGEAGLTAALALGDLVGTIGVSAGQEAKSLRFARRTGIFDRFAGHVAIGLDYADLQRPEFVSHRLIGAARKLRDENHASVIVFAGAGMGRYVRPVRKATRMPIIDPTQVAVALAVATVTQGA
jgi:Asp/Glu/hydantoin racemase